MKSRWRRYWRNILTKFWCWHNLCSVNIFSSKLKGPDPNYLILCSWILFRERNLKISIINLELFCNICAILQLQKKLQPKMRKISRNKKVTWSYCKVLPCRWKASVKNLHNALDEEEKRRKLGDSRANRQIVQKSVCPAVLRPYRVR